MYCPKCGVENPDGAQLCSSCSWVLTGVSTIGPAPDARTSRLAVASLVLAILSFFTFFITAIPAFILGLVSIFKIEKSAGKLKGRGLAIAGIAVPPAAVIPFALMLAILMPAIASTRAMAQRTVCAANLRQLGLAMHMYAAVNDGKYPPADKWCELLEPCYNNKKLLICPSAGQGRCHYAINPHAKPNSPPDTVLLFETHPGWNQSGGPEILSTDNHRNKGCNVLFNDMHIAFVKTKDLNDLKWTAE